MTIKRIGDLQTWFQISKYDFLKWVIQNKYYVFFWNGNMNKILFGGSVKLAAFKSRTVDLQLQFVYS